MSFRTIALAATLLASGAFLPIADARAVTLDNSATATGSISSFGYPDSQTYGQVFTAPITGILESFSLALNGGVGDIFGAVGSWNGGSTFGFDHGSPTTLYKSDAQSSGTGGVFTFHPGISVIAGVQYVAYLSVYGLAATAQTTMPIDSANTTPYINYFVWNNTSNPEGNTTWNYFFNAGSARFTAEFSVPGPVAASGLPALMAIAGFAAWRRRRDQAA